MLSLTQQNNADAAVHKLLIHLGLYIKADTVSAELEKHPDYPSLLSVSDVLASYNVESNALRISFDELAGVSCPYLAHTDSNGGELLLVTKTDDDNFFVSNEKWNKRKLSAQIFKKIFTGVIFTTDLSEKYKTNTTLKTILTGIEIPAIMGVGLLIMLLLAFHTDYFVVLNWQTLLLTLFKTGGLITSILLLIQSIDNNNPLVQVLCQTKGKTNCNAILSSKAAKVPMLELTWSEVGFFYFAGTWLLLLFGGGTRFTFGILLIINILSLPYTVYSIYYQARIAKQWCLLCCSIQALLWLEFLSLALNRDRNLFSIIAINFYGAEGWNVGALSSLFICLFTPVILWLLLKPLFIKLQQLQPLKQQLRNFKYNTELFNKLLSEQPKYTTPDENWSIVLGNPEADKIITMVTNPYCPPCAKTHNLLDELLDERDDIQARIVFTANNTERDLKTPISRHLMAINDHKDKTVVRKALHDWYEQKQKNYEDFAKAYPVELKEKQYYKIDKQRDWCQLAEVTATPTLLLNGYRLPQLYQLPDLKYMLEKST
jgi:uncharacterized membrane protein